MLKALWTLIKLGILVGGIVWLAERPGSVTIEWMEYTINLHFGFFIVILIGMMLLAMMIFGLIKMAVDLPDKYKEYTARKRQEKGYRALTLGLTAVAAGDAKISAYQAYRARKFLPEDEGLPVLLEAQAARLQGREKDAQEGFAKLVMNKDTAFMGVRGLLQSAMDNKDFGRATNLAERALALNPKQPWIMKVLYDLHIKNHNWSAARPMLAKLERQGIIPAHKALAHKIAMLIDEADNEKNSAAKQKHIKEALKLDPNFIPAVERSADIYIKEGKQGTAETLIKKVWKDSPHPVLVPLWTQAMPDKTAEKPSEKLKWYDKLLDINSDCPALYLEAAQAAMEEGLWGEAKSYIEDSENIATTTKTYYAKAKLAELSGAPAEEAAKLRVTATEQPPEQGWVCQESGLVYPRWVAIAEPHGAFNSIIWGTPSAALPYMSHLKSDSALPAPNEDIPEPTIPSAPPSIADITAALDSPKN